MMQSHEVHGARIPKIGMGTFRLDNQLAAERIKEAIDIGYRHIDTAQMYANEQGVGTALKSSRIAREELFVTTKIWPDRFQEGDLQRSVAESLERLQLDAVDLLLLHWPNPNVPLDETIAALNAVVENGWTRHIGLSNFTVPLIREAVALSQRPLVTNQVEYHPRLSQAPVLEELARHDMALTAYCPLGQGRLLDHPAIGEIATGHGKTPAQVILRWHYQQPGVIAIPRSSRAERLRENFSILDFSLTDAEMATLHRLEHPDGRIINPAELAPSWDQIA